MASATATKPAGKANGKATVQKAKDKLADFQVVCQAEGVSIINHLARDGRTYDGVSVDGDAWSVVGPLTVGNAPTIDCRNCKKSVAKALRGADVGDPPTEIVAGAQPKAEKVAKEPKPKAEPKPKKADAPVAEVTNVERHTRFQNSTIEATCGNCGKNSEFYARSWAGIGYMNCRSCGARLNYPFPKGEARKAAYKEEVAARKAARAAATAERRATKAARSKVNPEVALADAKARQGKAAKAVERLTTYLAQSQAKLDRATKAVEAATARLEAAKNQPTSESDEAPVDDQPEIAGDQAEVETVGVDEPTATDEPKAE